MTTNATSSIFNGTRTSRYSPFTSSVRSTCLRRCVGPYTVASIIFILISLPLLVSSDDNGGSDGSVDPDVDQSHEFLGLNSLLFVFIVGLCMFTARLIRDFKFFYLPASGASMILGLFIGLFCTLFGEEETKFMFFSTNFFFYVLLPPIIFDAGFSLKRRSFFRNFTTINMFAVLGTLVSTFVIGYGLYAMAKIGMISLSKKDPLECLTFAALISAVDPVATLSILGSPDINADPLLYSLVFGESVLNDAVSIVLFKTFQRIAPGTKLSILKLVGSFISVSVSSIAIGTAVALLCAFTLRFISFKDSPAHEYTLIVLFAYASYCISEILQISGVMALFFCGIVMSHYASYNLSNLAQHSVPYVIHSFALLAETFLFAYVGITAGISFLPAPDIVSKQLSWSPVLVIITLLLCFASRALHIFPFSAFVNLRRKRPISFSMQIVMWFGGLRGAVAFALALSIDSVNRGLIVTTTLTVVFFTTLVCGGLTEPLLTKMNLRQSIRDSQNPLVDRGGHTRDEDDIDDDETEVIGGVHLMWKTFDSMYMRHWFGGPSSAQGRILTQERRLPEFVSLSNIGDISRQHSPSIGLRESSA